MVELGRLEKIADLREVWPDEAGDFTPWLAREDNLKLLSDTIGIDLDCTPDNGQIIKQWYLKQHPLRTEQEICNRMICSKGGSLHHPTADHFLRDVLQSKAIMPKSWS